MEDVYTIQLISMCCRTEFSLFMSYKFSPSISSIFFFIFRYFRESRWFFFWPFTFTTAMPPKKSMGLVLSPISGCVKSDPPVPHDLSDLLLLLNHFQLSFNTKLILSTIYAYDSYTSHKRVRPSIISRFNLHEIDLLCEGNDTALSVLRRVSVLFWTWSHDCF